MTGVRWGIFGGTFDPIHFAHLTVAEQAREALDLARVLFVPAGQPVHRPTPRASGDDRVRMIELAIADNPRFAVSRLEVDSDRPSYTVDTLERLAAENPGDKLVMIVSSEAAAELPIWRTPQRLLELAHVAIVPRLRHETLTPQWLTEEFPGVAERFLFLETTTHLGHSATDIRARVAQGKSIRYLVPPAVEAYIKERQLYGPTDRPAA